MKQAVNNGLSSERLRYGHEGKERKANRETDGFSKY